MILQKLKADAEAYLGEPVTDAVVTVPAYFNNAQREATKGTAIESGRSSDGWTTDQQQSSSHLFDKPFAGPEPGPGPRIPCIEQAVVRRTI